MHLQIPLALISVLTLMVFLLTTLDKWEKLSIIDPLPWKRNRLTVC